MALTKKQDALAKMLGRFTDTRRKVDIAKAAGFSESRLHQLQHEHEFMAVVAEESEHHKALLLLECDRALFRQVQRGDVRAIDLAYKRCGVIQTGGNQVVNVNTTDDLATRLSTSIADRARTATH